MKKTALILTASSLLALSANAQIFTLANTDDAVFEHADGGVNSPSPIPLAGSQSVGNGTFSWGNLATDGSRNYAIFSGGTFESSDFGGQGTFTSISIDVSSFTSVDISAVFDGDFNTSSEFAHFFYQLDGGTEVEFGVSTQGVEYTDEPVTLAGLDTSGASSLIVGFDFSHNGSGDYFNVDSFSVVGTAVPEPSTYAMIAGVMALGLAYMRRRK